MKRCHLMAAAGVLAAAAFLSPARADVPPPNACSTAGQSCQTAGPSYDQPGVCTATTCSRSLPDGDGGVSTMEYDCTLCLPAGSGATSGGSSPRAEPSDSGCSVGRAANGDLRGALAGAMLLAGVASLLAGRRRG